MNVLGIETSCDETSIAVVQNGKKILSNIIASQEIIHQRFGGIVPELASRVHTEIIDSIFLNALRKSGVIIKKINLIAVTGSPGLKGSLLIGKVFARSLAFTHQIPLIEINHLHAHLAANFLAGEEIKFPAIGLVVSGGHTNLFYLKNRTKIEPLGETLDDAAGEVFDKVARVLNLGYPGGPALEKVAEKGNPAIKFPCAYMGKESLNFSFSGVKTSVIYYMKEHLHPSIADVAASFQHAIIKVLIEKLKRAIKLKKVKTVLLGGGVVSNKLLRQEMKKITLAEKINLLIPPPVLCTDNAAMVASLGYYLGQEEPSLLRGAGHRSQRRH